MVKAMDYAHRDLFNVFWPSKWILQLQLFRASGPYINQEKDWRSEDVVLLTLLKRSRNKGEKEGSTVPLLVFRRRTDSRATLPKLLDEVFVMILTIVIGLLPILLLTFLEN